MNNSDVLKELEQKNQAIYHNALNMNLDVNLENMLITINDIIDRLNEEFIGYIKEITKNEDEVTFPESLNEKIKELIKKRTENLKESIVNIEKIDYQVVLDKEKNSLLKKIENVYKANIVSLIKSLFSNLNDAQKGRLDEYLNNTFYNKLRDRIREKMNNFDVILLNNYEEIYQRYLNLGRNNQKTLK